LLTLPEGQENDGLDGAELEDRVEGSEKITRSVVKEEQAVQSQTDGNVVDHCDVDVTLGQAEIKSPVQT
jgi:hypothetical protein